jgi:hypothetical protein
MYCFRCNKEIEIVHGHDDMPGHALVFTSHGNYGSRLFDSMHAWLRIYICDDCVKANYAQVEVGRVTKREKQITEYEPLDLDKVSGDAYQ